MGKRKSIARKIKWVLHISMFIEVCGGKYGKIPPTGIRKVKDSKYTGSVTMMQCGVLGLQSKLKFKIKKNQNSFFPKLTRY